MYSPRIITENIIFISYKVVDTDSHTFGRTDISRVLPGENVKLFAFDTNLFILGVDVNTLNQKCNYCIETLNQ